MLMPRNIALVVKGIILPSITIESLSILTRFYLVWNSIATDLITFIGLKLHYYFRYFNINKFYYCFCIRINIKNVGIVSIKNECLLRNVYS